MPTTGDSFLDLKNRVQHKLIAELDPKLDLTRTDEVRRQVEEIFSEILDAENIVLPRTLEGNEHIWHLYVIRIRDRDRVLKELHAAGIGAGIHYPVPVHLTPAFAGLGYPEGTFPVAEQTAGELLSLPLFAEITAAQQERVVSVLTAALR